jgi:DNA polymerase III sliding clamp (beta) subunit (PCNA family)
VVHAVKVASHAVAKEPSRYAIDGILLESNEKGSRLVATDGRRLVMVELRNCGELDDQALMPHRFCRLIDKLTDRDTDFLAIAVHRETNEKGESLPGRIFAAGPDWVIATYECDGRFPIYRDVMPRSSSKFAIPRAALVETLAEVALTTNEESRMVRLDLGPQELLLQAEAPGSRAVPRLDCRVSSWAAATRSSARRSTRHTCWTRSRRSTATRSSSTSVRTATAAIARSSASLP